MEVVSWATCDVLSVCGLSLSCVSRPVCPVLCVPSRAVLISVYVAELYFNLINRYLYLLVLLINR